MGRKAWFKCFNECGETYPLSEVIYKCEKCGSLLQVAHDEENLKKTSPDEWKNLFDQRNVRNIWPFGSGVWNKKEWVCPDIE
ncbi:MAG: threonine synthase, partial [Nitrospinota bacterium]